MKLERPEVEAVEITVCKKIGTKYVESKSFRVYDTTVKRVSSVIRKSLESQCNRENTEVSPESTNQPS